MILTEQESKDECFKVNMEAAVNLASFLTGLWRLELTI